MTISLILAAADNGVIGKDGAIPWRIAGEQRRFKDLTMGKPVVMGRKTWDSLPRKPLPGRENIVVTRDPSFRADGARVERDLAAVLKGEVMVIGGAEIYRAALPLADRIELTEVHGDFDGDAVFTFDRGPWREIARERHATPEGLQYSYVTLVRA